VGGVDDDDPILWYTVFISISGYMSSPVPRARVKVRVSDLVMDPEINESIFFC
jgi:hypothetical protein